MEKKWYQSKWFAALISGLLGLAAGAVITLNVFSNNHIDFSQKYFLGEFGEKTVNKDSLAVLVYRLQLRLDAISAEGPQLEAAQDTLLGSFDQTDANILDRIDSRQNEIEDEVKLIKTLKNKILQFFDDGVDQTAILKDVYSYFGGKLKIQPKQSLADILKIEDGERKVKEKIDDILKSKNDDIATLEAKIKSLQNLVNKLTNDNLLLQNKYNLALKDLGVRDSTILAGNNRIKLQSDTIKSKDNIIADRDTTIKNTTKISIESFSARITNAKVVNDGTRKRNNLKLNINFDFSFNKPEDRISNNQNELFNLYIYKEDVTEPVLKQENIPIDAKKPYEKIIELDKMENGEYCIMMVWTKDASIYISKPLTIGHRGPRGGMNSCK